MNFEPLDPASTGVRLKRSLLRQCLKTPPFESRERLGYRAIRKSQTDHRIAPGFWWPMCEEAKDAIECIETGTLQDPDAGERWSGKGEHGEMVRRY